MSRSSCGYFTPAFFLLHPPGAATVCNPGASAPCASGWAVTKHRYLTGPAVRAGWQMLSCSVYLQAFQSLVML